MWIHVAVEQSGNIHLKLYWMLFGIVGSTEISELIGKFNCWHNPACILDTEEGYRFMFCRKGFETNSIRCWPLNSICLSPRTDPCQTVIQIRQFLRVHKTNGWIFIHGFIEFQSHQFCSMMINVLRNVSNIIPMVY